MKVHPLRALTYLLLLAGIIWIAARFFEQLQTPSGEASAPVDTVDEVELRVAADGDAWVCVVDGREFREQDALRSYMATEHAGRDAVIRSAQVRDGARLAPAIQACREAGLQSVRMQLDGGTDEQ